MLGFKYSKIQKGREREQESKTLSASKQPSYGECTLLGSSSTRAWLSALAGDSWPHGEWVRVRTCKVSHRTGHLETIDVSSWVTEGSTVKFKRGLYMAWQWRLFEYSPPSVTPVEQKWYSPRNKSAGAWGSQLRRYRVVPLQLLFKVAFSNRTLGGVCSRTWVCESVHDLFIYLHYWLWKSKIRIHCLICPWQDSLTKKKSIKCSGYFSYLLIFLIFNFSVSVTHQPLILSWMIVRSDKNNAWIERQKCKYLNSPAIIFIYFFHIFSFEHLCTFALILNVLG